MKQKTSLSLSASIGIMIFGLFFGAGNLIFPIHMGQLAGTSYWPALAGFLITAIGLPLIGIIAIGLSGGNGLRHLADRIHPVFGAIFSFLLYLTIGPFFAIPRTATVPFAVGLKPFVPTDQNTFWLVLFSLLFFAAVFYLSLNSAKAMDIIGKYLTPAFLLCLFILITAAIVHPMGHFDKPDGDYGSMPFITGFMEGYNTMDTLAALAFGIVVIQAIKNAGITNPRAVARTTLKSGLFAMGLMAVIYSLIAFIGASSVKEIGTLENGGLIFSAVSAYYFYTPGLILLAFIILLACLKTSIGLMVACGEFLHHTFPKVSYKLFVLMLSFLSFAIANLGLTAIIQYAVPVLMFLYPLAIVLIILGLASNLFKLERSVYIWTMILTCLISIMDGYQQLTQTIPGIRNIFLGTINKYYESYLPLYDIGLGWILPAMIGAIFGILISKGRTNTV